MKMIYICAALLCFMSFGIYANDIVDKSTGESFPSEVKFEENGKQYTLEATGVSVRKKFLVKIYSVASYLQKGVKLKNGDKLQAIMSDENAKQITMKWVRDVSSEKVQSAFQDSLHKVFPAEKYQQYEGDINKFFQFFQQGVHKGDEIILRWLPGGTIEAIINGNAAGSITNPEFAKGIWSIWFGEHSVVDRNDLLENLK